MTGISYAAASRTQSATIRKAGRLGRAANERRHGESVGPQPHGVQRVGELLAGRIVGPGARALHDQRNAARVGLPGRGGDPLVHRHRVGPRGDHRRQRRADVPQPRGSPAPYPIK